MTWNWKAPPTEMYITAAGMVTPVGFNWQTSCAAMRAGIDAFAEEDLWDDEAGEYLKAAKVHLPQWWEGLGKLVDLVTPAIAECLDAARPMTSREIPILLGVAAPCRVPRMEGLDDQILSDIEYKLGISRHRYSEIIPRGRVSGVVALQRAAELLRDSKANACIVAGVDSFVDRDVVRHYRENSRILTANNSNGFIPGEAGCAVLVTNIYSSDEELRVLGIGEGNESGTIESDIPLTGDGLTSAIREATKQAGLTMADTHYWITDQNAEAYKAKECTIAQIRLERRDKPAEIPYQIWNPVEFIGEVGAAIGSCLLGVVLTASKKGYTPGNRVLVTTGEDDEQRAAAVLEWKKG